jgi:hypothetical protein
MTAAAVLTALAIRTARADSMSAARDDGEITLDATDLVEV